MEYTFQLKNLVGNLARDEGANLSQPSFGTGGQALVSIGARGWSIGNCGMGLASCLATCSSYSRELLDQGHWPV
jgi:hypothetical protein